jgi:hypothetical protein
MIGGYWLDTFATGRLREKKKMNVFGRENKDGTRHIGLETWLDMEL